MCFLGGGSDWTKLPPAQLVFRSRSPDSGDPGPPGPPGLVGGRTLGNSKMAALREFCSVPEELPGCQPPSPKNPQISNGKPLGTCPWLYGMIFKSDLFTIVYQLIQTPCDYHRTCNSEQIYIYIIWYNNNSIIIILGDNSREFVDESGTLSQYRRDGRWPSKVRLGIMWSNQSW